MGYERGEKADNRDRSDNFSFLQRERKLSNQEECKLGIAVHYWCCLRSHIVVAMLADRSTGSRKISRKICNTISKTRASFDTGHRRRVFNNLISNKLNS